MPLLLLFIKLILAVRNPFSNKKYQAGLVNNAILVYRQNPEIVIGDYCRYVQELLLSKLGDIKKNIVIFYECPGLGFLKYCMPSANIYLQIEHTLLKHQLSNTEFTFSGNLKISNQDKSYLVRIDNFDKLNQADVVFDYSRINLHNIRSSTDLLAYSKKTFCISPAIYPLKLSIDGRSGAITLFGNTNIPRRKLFLEDLDKHQVVSQNISGVYFGVEKVYEKAKIVINIRQSDLYDTLEELRVLPALRSGAIVICENAPYMQKTAYSQFVIWGSIEEIPSLIIEVEKNYEAVHRRIFGDGSENSRFVKRMRRIEKCNQLAMNRAINLVNNKN